MEKYDVIVLGSGIKECLLSGMLSSSGRRVLHLDRNKYYGGESASIYPLEVLFKKFNMPHAQLGDYIRSKDWNVDLVPKFFMTNDKILKLLILTGVSGFLHFKTIETSYVYKDGEIYEVPTLKRKTGGSNLMSVSEEERFWDFIMFAYHYNPEDPKTWMEIDVGVTTSAQLYEKFGLDKDTADFTGHAVALYGDDDYLSKPCLDTINKIKLYYKYLGPYRKCPYMYPLYGLGELQQAFVRRCALNAGIFALNMPIDELVMENGKVVGVRSGNKTIHCEQLYCDPSYVPDRTEKVGQVVRCICLLNHPIPNTGDARSCQIIIPQKQVGRKSDIYVSVVSSTHQVASEGWFVAVVSTTVETNNPEQEIKPGLDLLGPIKQKFLKVSDYFKPKDNGEDSQIFISESYDATFHFESTFLDVHDIFLRGTGKNVELDSCKIREEHFDILRDEYDSDEEEEKLREISWSNYIEELSLPELSSGSEEEETDGDD